MTGSPVPVRVALLFILAVAAALRLAGAGYGLPFPLVSDEEILIGGALKMAQTFNPFPTLDPELARQLYYPVGLPWLYLVVFAPVVAVLFVLSGFPPPGDLPLMLADHLGTLFLAARLTSVAMAVATVWVIWRLALRLFDSPVAGLVAATLIATCWFHIILGAVARHWSATVFLIWLTVLLAAGYREHPTVRRACACGLTAALGFGVSFIGALGYAGFVIAHALRFRGRTVNRMLTCSLLVLAAGVAVFAAASLPALLRLVGATPVLPVDDAKSFAGLAEAAWFYLRNVWYADPVLLVAGLGGACLAAPRMRWRVGLLLSAVLVYVAFLYVFMPLEDRYILPALPALALLAGAGVAVTLASLRVRGPRAVLAVPVVAGLAWSGWNAVTIARLMHAEDSRVLAAAWTQANLPDGTAVAVSLNPVKLPASFEGLRAQASLDPDSLDFADRQRLDRVVQGGFTALHLNRFPLESMEPAKATALLDRLMAMGYRHFLLAHRYDREPDAFWQAVGARATPLFAVDPAVDGVYPPDLRTTTLVHEAPVSRFARLDRLGHAVTLFRIDEDESASRESR